MRKGGQYPDKIGNELKDGGNDRIELPIYGSKGKLKCILKCIDKHPRWSISIKDGSRNLFV